MANTALNRTVQLLLTNKSGGSVAQGDVVVLDGTTASSFTTTTTAGYTTTIVGVVLEPNGIASNAMGMIAFGGYVPKINLSGSASLLDMVKTHTVAKQGVRHAAPSVAGDFAIVLGTGTSPPAELFGMNFATGGGASGNSTSNTAVGSEPGSPASGDVDYYSSASMIARYSGSAWKTWGPLHPFEACPASTGGPSSTQFGWINQNSATVSTTAGGVVLSQPANSADSWTFLIKTLQAAPYTLTAHLRSVLVANTNGYGVILRKSSDSTFICFGYYFSGSHNIFIGSGNSTPAITTVQFSSAGCPPYPWLRIVDDNTNRTYHVSPNGQHWSQVYTQARTTPLTPDQAGFGGESRSSTVQLVTTLESWKEA